MAMIGADKQFLPNTCAVLPHADQRRLVYCYACYALCFDISRHPNRPRDVTHCCLFTYRWWGCVCRGIQAGREFSNSLLCSSQSCHHLRCGCAVLFDWATDCIEMGGDHGVRVGPDDSLCWVWGTANVQKNDNTIGKLNSLRGCCGLTGVWWSL